MNFHRVISYSILSGLLVGCGNSNYDGKAIGSLLARPPEDSQCVKPKTQMKIVSSAFETKGRKVQLNENGLGETSLFSSKSTNTVIKSGKELVLVVDENCVENERSLQTELSQTGLTSVISIEDTPTNEKSHLITLTEDVLLSDLDELAESDNCVKGVGENIEMKTTAAPNDPRYADQRHLNNLKAEIGWDKFFSATSGITQDVVIAVIDSGVDTDHEDLAQNMWVNSGEVAGDGRDNDGNGYIDDVHGYDFASGSGDPNPKTWSGSQAGGENHGTHVAGLSAGRTNNSKGISGVNGLKVKIMALNVFGSVAGASTPNIDNAIRYAADKGAHVINMSLGGPGAASSTSSAIAYAINKGVFVLAAAGNSNEDIQSNFFTPASYGQQYNGMFAIGATDASSSGKCSFSNYNSTYVEMAAPGCQSGTSGLMSTVIGSYGRMQGTSMASPVAAGAASLAYGLVWSRKGSKPTPAEVEEIMFTGARVEAGLTGSFKQGKVVDLDLLYKEIDKRYPAGSGGTPNPTPTPDAGCTK